MNEFSPGPLIYDPQGLELSEVEKEILVHPMIGGILLFARNFEHKEQCYDLCRSIRECRSNLPIFVDQEGGRVQRFKADFPLVDHMEVFGKQVQEDPINGKKNLRAAMVKMIEALKKCELTSDLIPVLDLDRGNNPALRGRSFSDDPKIVVECAEVVLDVLAEYGISSTAKHFPGHGGVAEDSHHSLPHDTRSLEDLWKQDMQPFIKLLPRLDSIMPGHVIYTAIDDEMPASISPKWLREILRERLGFQKIIISDDLNMGAMIEYGDIVQRVMLALKAGCDYTLVCNSQRDTIKVMDTMKVYHDELSEFRRVQFAQRFIL